MELLQKYSKKKKNPDSIRIIYLEKFDKQIINKVPYCLFLSLILFFVIPAVGIDLLLWSLVIFIISTILFNWLVNKDIEPSLISLDFRNFKNKMSLIFEGKSSVIDDIKISENWAFIFLGVLSGLSFTFLLTFSFLTVLDSFQIVRKELVIVGLIFVIIYLFQDIIKFTATGSEDSKDSGGNASFLLDMMEMYIMNNSLKQIRGNTVLLQSIVAVLSRILGPVVHLSFPKFTFDRILIYKNPEVVELIKKLNVANMVHKEHDNICLKYIDGCPEWKFFEPRYGEKLTNLIELSPKKIYPYLLDPNYSYNKNEKRKRKWIVFNILKECQKDNKIVGYAFLHEFKGAIAKRNYRKSRHNQYETKPVFLFTFVGERNIIEYLKYQIEIISSKVPLDSINVEINGEDIENYP